MPLVQVSQNTSPCQVDDFGEGCERSKPGALYFVPGSLKQLTVGEWEHIKAKHKGFAAKLLLVPFDEDKLQAPKAKAAEAPVRASSRPTAAQRRAAKSQPATPPPEGPGGENS